MRRLIVHVGPAKTGTSAIQHALVTPEDGPFCYPKVGLWADGSHHNLMYSMVPQDRRPEAEILPWGDALRQLRAAAMRSNKDVLVSSELLNGSIVSTFVAELAGSLEDLLGEVVLVMVVREHLERAASIYNQRVKDSFYCERRAPDDFLAAEAAGLVYRPLGAALKATGHKVLVLNYHGDADLAARFVAELGGDPTRLPPAARRNVSIGMKGLVSVLESNRLHGPAGCGRYFAALRRMHGFFSGGAFPFSASGVERVRATFEADAEFLANEFDVELPRRNSERCDGRLVINPNEFAEIKGALSAAQITDIALLAAIKRYVSDAASRTLPIDEAKLLNPGDRHYTAYVGPPGQYDFMGASQFRLLCTLGLRENHRLLDFGCGSLRAGRLLIPYLREGCYCGLDPNKWLIDDAIERETGRDLIDLKRPVFRYDDNFDATCFGRTFDFILVQSVFSHAGRDIISRSFAGLKQCLEPNGLILATFIHPDQPGADKEFSGAGWVYPEVVSYRPQTVLNMIGAAALAGRALPWFHPRQTWYAIAHSLKLLPPVSKYPHLSGAVLRDPELAASS